MTKLIKRALILAKEEVTYGTDSIPDTANNAILALNPNVKAAGEKLERNPAMGNLGRLGALIGKQWVELTFSVELKGSGTIDAAPRIGDILESCAMAETVNAGVSVVYNPVSTGIKSCTIYAYFDGILHKITGCRGTFEIIAAAGQIVMLNFTMQGLYQAPIDTAFPGSVTYESTIPPVFKNASFTLNAISTLVVQQLQVALQNELSQSDDVNAATGIKEISIVDRNPIGSFNPEVPAIAAYDFHADWAAASKRALSAVVGSAEGNKITISAPKVTLDEMGPGDRNGILIYDIPISLAIDSGDDEMELKFE